MTHYSTLQVPENASHTEIRSAYRRLVKLYHPDLNPTEEARALIPKITTAYEILSDPSKKLLYDYQLQGLSSIEIPNPEEDERTLRKRAYIKKRRQQEQEHWEQLLRMKVKFYRVQRYFSWLFLGLSLFYSYDYFATSVHGVYQVEDVSLSKWGNTNINLGWLSLESSGDLYSDIRKFQIDSVTLHYSRFLDIPVGIELDKIGYYLVNGTLHSYGNFFSYLLFILALVLVFNHKYSDWSLTLGILPFFISAFLLLFTYATLKGLNI